MTVATESAANIATPIRRVLSLRKYGHGGAVPRKTAIVGSASREDTKWLGMPSCVSPAWTAFRPPEGAHTDAGGVRPGCSGVDYAADFSVAGDRLPAAAGAFSRPTVYGNGARAGCSGGGGFGQRRGLGRWGEMSVATDRTSSRLPIRYSVKGVGANMLSRSEDQRLKSGLARSTGSVVSDRTPEPEQERGIPSSYSDCGHSDRTSVYRARHRYD